MRNFEKVSAVFCFISTISVFSLWFHLCCRPLRHAETTGYSLCHALYDLSYFQIYYLTNISHAKEFHVWYLAFVNGLVASGLVSFQCCPTCIRTILSSLFFLKKRGSKAWTLHLRYICVYECEWSFVIIDTILRKYAGISHIICIFEMRQTICNKNGRIDAHWTFWYDWKYSGRISVRKRPYSPLSTKSNIYTFIRIIITER